MAEVIIFSSIEYVYWFGKDAAVFEKYQLL